jgi:hypothetical protein
VEVIELNLDKENDLQFRVVVEGAGARSVRLLIESEGMNLSFPGRMNGDIVDVTVPPIKSVLGEGKYTAALEVIAEDRFFEPLRFEVDLSESIKIHEASIIRVNESKVGEHASTEPKPSKQGAKASIISVSGTKPEANKRLHETPKPTSNKRAPIKPAPSGHGRSNTKPDSDANVRKLIRRIMTE